MGSKEGTSPLPTSVPPHQLGSMGTLISRSGVQGKAQLPKKKVLPFYTTFGTQDDFS